MGHVAGSITEHVEYGSFGVPTLTSMHDPRVEGCLHCLAEGDSAALSGAAFMDAAMRLIWTVLEPRLLFIATVSTDGRDAHTVIAFENGRRVRDFTYHIAHSPSSEVMGPQDLCIYPFDVASIFPRDARLRALDAEGYVGMPLLARDGRRIGLVAAITTHPITNMDEARDVLKVFGARLSLELERTLADTGDRLAIERAALAEERHLIEAALSH